MNTNENKLVSVVVPTYNRETCVINALSSLLSQDYINYEILLVDQSDRHNPILMKFIQQHSEIKYFHIDKPNRCRAKNYGVSNSKGEIVLICDDDIVAPRNFITTHFKNYYDERIGAVSCRIIEEGQPTTYTKNVLDFNFFGKVTNNSHSLTSKYVKNLNGGNMSFRKKLFLEVGMLDEMFIGTGIMEEPDIALRIQKKGYKIYFDASCTVKHYPQNNGNLAALDNNRAWYFYCYFNNLVYCLRKNDEFYKLFFCFGYAVLLTLKQTIQYKLSITDFFHILNGYFTGFTMKIASPSRD